MASQASLTSAVNIFFILSLLLVTKFLPQVDCRPLDKPKKPTEEENKKITRNNNNGNDRQSGGEAKANSLSFNKYNNSIDKAKMKQPVKEMKDLPPFPNFPFPFAPPFPQPQLPPFPYPLPDFPLPPFPFPPIPFLSPPPA